MRTRTHELPQSSQCVVVAEMRVNQCHRVGAACDAHADTSNTISRASRRVEPARVWNVATRSSSQPGDAGVLSLRERETSRKVQAEMHSRGQGARRETDQRVKMKTAEEEHESCVEKQRTRV